MRRYLPLLCSCAADLPTVECLADPCAAACPAAEPGAICEPIVCLYGRMWDGSDVGVREGVHCGCKPYSLCGWLHCR